MKKNKINPKNKKNFVIVTHPGSFHADDVCAVATLLIYIEKSYGELFAKKTKIIRSSDAKIIETADFVVDVGLIHDEQSNRFDPYASFGLVWKKFGPYICGKQEIADTIDRIIVQDIDASDSGFDFYKTNIKGTAVFRATDMVVFERSSVKRDSNVAQNMYKSFIYMVGVMKRSIQNLIIDQVNSAKSVVIAKSLYDKLEDKRVLVLPQDTFLIRKDIPETRVIVYKTTRGTWAIESVKNDYDTFESSFDFPEEWAGLSAEKLQDVTGIKEAAFAHPGRFYVAATTKLGAIKMAELAIKLSGNK
jgi:uncharacterized UPF0160 family protein